MRLISLIPNLKEQSTPILTYSLYPYTFDNTGTFCGSSVITETYFILNKRRNTPTKQVMMEINYVPDNLRNNNIRPKSTVNR